MYFLKREKIIFRIKNVNFREHLKFFCKAHLFPLSFIIALLPLAAYRVPGDQQGPCYFPCWQPSR